MVRITVIVTAATKAHRTTRYNQIWRVSNDEIETMICFYKDEFYIVGEENSSGSGEAKCSYRFREQRKILSILYIDNEIRINFLF